MISGLPAALPSHARTLLALTGMRAFDKKTTIFCGLFHTSSSHPSLYVVLF
jgi:hypothetical protein